MTLTRSPAEIAAFFEIPSPAGAEALAGPDGEALRARFNIAPSQPVLTVVAAAGAGRALAWKTWGLVPAWARDPSIGARLFNARAETVDTKPSFRSAFKRRRCLVVADGFYEWSARSRGHRPYWFHPTLHPREAPLLAFAGLFEHWAMETGPAIESCTVVTTDANADLAGVHARMPVVLARPAWRAWLDPDADPDALKGLLAPAPDGTLAARPVSRHVNDPRHDDSRCLEPEAASEPTPRTQLVLDGTLD